MTISVILPSQVFWAFLCQLVLFLFLVETSHELHHREELQSATTLARKGWRTDISEDFINMDGSLAG